MADQRDLLAAIGEVVVNTAILEYAVACLVALTEGDRDQACEDRAKVMIKGRPGKVMAELGRVCDEHPERRELKHVLHDARSVISDRHLLAHSIALEDTEADGLPAIVMYNARMDAETAITLPQVLSHVQDIRIAYRRVHALIEAALAGSRPQPGSI